MQTFEAIIDTAGVTKLARLFAIEESHVRVMKTRNSIPPEYWAAIVEHRDELGLDPIGLVDLHNIRRERFRVERKAVA